MKTAATPAAGQRLLFSATLDHGVDVLVRRFLKNELSHSVDEVELLLSQNVSMSYHVLRCINSSYYNLPRKIDSIRQAVVILGLDQLRQLCSLLCLQGFARRRGTPGRCP